MSAPRVFIGDPVETLGGTVSPLIPDCGVEAGDLIFVQAVQTESPTISWVAPGAPFLSFGTGLNSPIQASNYFKIAVGGETGAVNVSTTAPGADTKTGRVCVMKGYDSGYVQNAAFEFLPRAQSSQSGGATNATFFGLLGNVWQSGWYRTLFGMGVVAGAPLAQLGPYTNQAGSRTKYELLGFFPTTLGTGFTIFVQIGHLLYGQAGLTTPQYAMGVGARQYNTIYNTFPGAPPGQEAPLIKGKGAI